MGTRALVRVFDGDTECCCIYRQHDGYPEGLGREVRDFVASKGIVNGISSRYDHSRIANGMGCLAAQLVVALKHDVGSVYLHPPGTHDVGEEFEYHVHGPAMGAPSDAGDDAPKPATVTAFEIRNRPQRPVLPVQIPDDAEKGKGA